jgi:hypothetical protein
VATLGGQLHALREVAYLTGAPDDQPLASEVEI